MKKLLVTFLLFLSVAVGAQVPVLQQAQATAKAAHKLILLTFSGSDWCIPCIRMEKEVFEKDAFSQYAKEHLVVVQADFPRLKKHRLPKELQQQNNALAQQYNNKGSFPFTVLLDAEGKIIKEWEGVVADSPKHFIQQIEEAQHVR